ncbi:MAG: DUF222 domain-containing protein [Micromonosporaceae bacterium]
MGELVAAASALEAQAGELRLRLVAEAHGRGVAGREAACSTQSWLRARTRVSPAVAKGQVVLAAGLASGELEPTREALSAGRISVAHAQVIARVIAELPGTDLPGGGVPGGAAGAEMSGAGVAGRVRGLAQARLVEWAEQFDPVQLARLGRRIEERVAPEIADGREADRLAELEKRAWRRRELRFTPDGHGTVQVRGRLDTESAAVVQRALDPLAKPRPTDPDSADMRSPGARTADALVEVCRRALASGGLPVQRGQLPQLVITVTADRLPAAAHGLPAPAGAAGVGVGVGRLDNGERVSPGVVRRIGCDAAATPAVVDRGGVPLALGRTQRLFSPAQRRALILRDGGCAFPGCDRPPQWTEAHHVVHWVDGGATDIDNGVLLCGYHHRVIHKGAWRVRMAGDKRPEFVPPEYIDPTRRPIRNHFRIPQRE